MDIQKWTRPPNYAGATFYNYYVGPGQSRDSDIDEMSRFEIALERLGGESATVLVARASHWRVGWVESILVHEDDTTNIAELQRIADTWEV